MHPKIFSCFSKTSLGKSYKDFIIIFPCIILTIYFIISPGVLPRTPTMVLPRIILEILPRISRKTYQGFFRNYFKDSFCGFLKNSSTKHILGRSIISMIFSVKVIPRILTQINLKILQGSRDSCKYFILEFCRPSSKNSFSDFFKDSFFYL